MCAKVGWGDDADTVDIGFDADELEQIVVGIECYTLNVLRAIIRVDDGDANSYLKSSDSACCGNRLAQSTCCEAEDTSEPAKYSTPFQLDCLPGGKTSYNEKCLCAEKGEREMLPALLKINFAVGPRWELPPQ